LNMDHRRSTAKTLVNKVRLNTKILNNKGLVSQHTQGLDLALVQLGH